MKSKSLFTLLIAFFVLIIVGVFVLNLNPKDAAIVHADVGEYAYVTQGTPFDLAISHEDEPSRVLFKAGKSEITFSNFITFDEWEMKGDKVIAESKDYSVTYSLIKNSSDRATGIKEEIILHKPTDQNIYTFNLGFENLYYQKREDGLWHFYNAADEEVFFIPAPFMYDAAGARSENVTIEIKDSKLTVILDKSWLFSNDRVYPIVIDPTIQLTIITVHSHPITGETWVVDFITEGKEDLTITPDDQATIDDIDFVSLTCNGEKVTPQILEDDIIFVPGWECNGTGAITHLVNVAAPHRLKFNFGGVVAYAYNAPGSTTYTYSGVTQATNDFFAYEKYGAASFTGPDDTGNSEASDSDYTSITADDSSRWSTDLASTTGHYDAQLYKLFISESEPTVSQLYFEANGYGTTASNYDTTLFAYDYDASSWFELDAVDFTVAADQSLTHTSTSEPGRFIDTDGEVTLMVHTVYVSTSNDTIGPNDPSAAVADTTVGSQAWTSYTNVYSNDSNDASSGISKTEITYYIKATDFGFIYNHTCLGIEGITVEVDKASSSSSDLNDYSVRLVNGSGTIVGDNKADTSTDWGTSDSYATYGGSSDDWNASLTCSDITDSDFGVVFSAVNNMTGPPSTKTAYVDHIRVTVDYLY